MRGKQAGAFRGCQDEYYGAEALTGLDSPPLLARAIPSPAAAAPPKPKPMSALCPPPPAAWGDRGRLDSDGALVSIFPSAEIEISAPFRIKVACEPSSSMMPTEP